ncbi:hypothetical protein PFICI_03255 [Pestalotiopsis fici W106-1]|uniref:Zn(2)-C6 fungal-type domain-containing protein n=1 Tax=Pestalotiopsis fici (strain W106-1 / CGMCC3.15140) TaxID=1229662 RepID=W3XGT9_PESFW|nr:uncharacterized protein PFICI_03255 [Pestalotiopsis fici W106-1]ETS85230.1 hypothetical protein PFICI_03255 [Pestalotiopsis fici W106-1]
MRNQACEPCAKRKVRCDKEEPCSNCKRRKQDHCSYAEPPATNGIRKPEHVARPFVSRLSDSTAISPGAHVAISPHQSQEAATPADKNSKDPVIVEQDGQQYYLESRAWFVHGHRESGHRTVAATHPLLLKSAPAAFESILGAYSASQVSIPNCLREKGQMVFAIYKQRVHPFIKIMFNWDLERLELAMTSTSSTLLLDDAEKSLVSSIHLASIISLTDAECRERFGQPRTFIVTECVVMCEKAIAKTNLLSIKNVVALKALAIYLFVSLDCLSTQSLWTLMGLAIRNGEKLGVHRDGTLLGLSPPETEERRRLWWQLQYLDLILAIRLGVTPSTLMIEWDAKLPLNIEDEDFTPGSETFPKERVGLTSMAYCLFTYYVLYEQRRYHADKGRFELSWSTNQSIPIRTKETFIDHLEDGLNKKFLQYCDPIKPLHTILQIASRALICVFRQRILLTGGHVNQEDRGALLALSAQCIEYSIAFHSHQNIRAFRWLTTNGFPWPAFMIVLIEASNETDAEKCQRVWTVLSDLYTTNTSLLEFVEDRRRLHAAELTVAAWKSCKTKGTVDRDAPKPEFVRDLEDRLARFMATSTEVAAAQDMGRHEEPVATDAPQSFSLEDEADGLFDLNFEDIDWAFWNNFAN